MRLSVGRCRDPLEQDGADAHPRVVDVGFERETVAVAMKVVAELNANVKGAVADADYALESAVRQVAELVADRGR